MEAPRAAGGPNRTSPGVATRGVPGEVKGVEAGAPQLSGTVLFNDSGVPMDSGATIVRSSGSRRPSGEVVVLGSGSSQHPGDVTSHSLASNTTYPIGFNTPSPGTSIFRSYSPGPGGPGAYSSGCNPQSDSTCLHPHTSYEDRPRSILKKISSILMQKSPPVEKKKSQHWDEMNILSTYHPADKDYGFMKVDEPSTPYHRMEDSFEDLTSESSRSVTPEALAKRFATMDNTCPKAIQLGDNRSSESPNNAPQKNSSDFNKRRKAHYSEGKFLKAQKNLSLDADEDSKAGSVSISSGSQGVRLDSDPRPVQRSWAGKLAKDVKDETVLVTRSHIVQVKDSSIWRNQSPLALPIIMLEQNLQRKEYYSKGRYLRSCSHPELEEDSEDEHQDSESHG
uniref:Uncharacterized protein n=1 Tax=Otolemur garnettii TaxID=30611 RepID=H0XQG0_OTOGA